MYQTESSIDERYDAPALTKEGREQQLIAKAERLAEKKLEDGTASPQIIVHYLRLATEKARLEQELVRAQVDLAKAKTESYESAARIEELFTNAEAAFKRYSGASDDEEDPII